MAALATQTETIRIEYQEPGAAPDALTGEVLQRRYVLLDVERKLANGCRYVAYDMQRLARLHVEVVCAAPERRPLQLVRTDPKLARSRLRPPIAPPPLPIDSRPVAPAAPVVSAPVAAAPVVSAPVAAAPVVSAPVAAAPVVSAPAAAAPVVSRPVPAAPPRTAGVEVAWFAAGEDPAGPTETDHLDLAAYAERQSSLEQHASAMDAETYSRYALEPQSPAAPWAADQQTDAAALARELPRAWPARILATRPRVFVVGATLGLIAGLTLTWM